MNEKIHIAIIGPGYKPIPPTGWGAVESIIWDYYENLSKCPNITVSIINTANVSEIIDLCNQKNPDFVHIMYDDYITITPHLNTKHILYTSHYAYITHPNFPIQSQWYFENIFMKVIEYQRFLTIGIFAISDHIAEIYKNHGFNGHIHVIRNGARDDQFRYTDIPRFPDKSIYMAKIEMRKAQYKYQGISGIDFVGNYHDSPFVIHSSNYLGEWSKDHLYDSLTEYANLVLLSTGEADPLVVKEALMSGLGLVISECCTANLDLSKPFITVIPNDHLDDIDYIANAIVLNRKISIENRTKIREYGYTIFSWKQIINDYLNILYNEINNEYNEKKK